MTDKPMTRGWDKMDQYLKAAQRKHEERAVESAAQQPRHTGASVRISGRTGQSDEHLLGRDPYARERSDQ